MPKVRMSYDGWLALPATVRRRLGLATGAELEVELVDGAIILRPAGEAVERLPRSGGFANLNYSSGRKRRLAGAA